jgi:hypothetical protein
VLSFGRDEMVGDAEERIDRDSGADFLEGLADGALFESFEIVEFAADYAPAAGFGRAAAEREEEAAGFVNEQDAYADFWLIGGGHENLSIRYLGADSTKGGASPAPTMGG